MIPPAGLSRGQRRFVVGILAFYIAMFVILVVLASLGDIHAIRLIGIVFGLFGIALGLALIVRLLSRPPFRDTSWRNPR